MRSDESPDGDGPDVAREKTMTDRHTRLFTCLLAATALFAVSSCAEERNDRNYVQELALKKSAFDGEWYYG